MGSIDQTKIKPHAVVIPYPAQGHVTPLMQLAKLLHYRGFHITFVNTEFNHKRLIRSRGPDALKGLPDFQFKTIPDGLPPSDRDATQDIPALCASIRKNCLAPFVELISQLNSSGEVPPVSNIVSDGVMTFAIKAGETVGLPVVSLWTASACGLLGYLQYGELIKRGIVPFKDEKFLWDGTLDTPVDWIPGVNHLRLKDLPSFMRVTDVNDIMFDYLNKESHDCLKSSAIIFNTFDEFEHEALDFIAAKFPRNNMYTIGPLPLLCRQLPESDHFKSFRTSLWKEDSECLKWLDKQEPYSIVYVNYGSITVMSNEELKEFAWGLANSTHPFLWILRPDVLEGHDAILPQEYFEEIKDRGLIVNWCPQDQVLCHPSIGLFLTHCGWNSTIEAVCGGVPVICWPFFAEQQTNRRYACTTWGMGMEVNEDVKREDIEALVKEMMEGDEGKQVRQKAQEWKNIAVETTDIGGKSYNNFNRLLEEVFHHYT